MSATAIKKITIQNENAPKNWVIKNMAVKKVKIKNNTDKNPFLLSWKKLKAKNGIANNIADKRK